MFTPNLYLISISLIIILSPIIYHDIIHVKGGNIWIFLLYNIIMSIFAPIGAISYLMLLIIPKCRLILEIFYSNCLYNTKNYIKFAFNKLKTK